MLADAGGGQLYPMPIASMINQCIPYAAAIILSNQQMNHELYSLTVSSISNKSLVRILGLQNMAISNKVVGVIYILCPEWL